MGQDAGCGLVGCVGDVFVVDGDAGEQSAVEDASFGWFALVVEVVEVDEEFGELVQVGADAVLFALEEVERDRVGVVGLNEFEAFGFEFFALGCQELAFVFAGASELVEHVVEDLAHVGCFGFGERVALVGVFDLGFNAFGEDHRAGTCGGLATASRAGEVLVAVPCLVAGAFDHEPGPAGAVQDAFEVMIILLGSIAAGVLGIEVGLDAFPGFDVDEWFVGTVVGDATEGDDAVVVVGQDLVQPGGGDGSGRLGRGRSDGEAADFEFLNELGQRPVAGGVDGEREAHEVGSVGVYLDLSDFASFGVDDADIEVAQGCFGGGASDRGLSGSYP